MGKRANEIYIFLPNSMSKIKTHYPPPHLPVSFALTIGPCENKKHIIFAISQVVYFLISSYHETWIAILVLLSQNVKILHEKRRGCKFAHTNSQICEHGLNCNFGCTLFALVYDLVLCRIHIYIDKYETPGRNLNFKIQWYIT